MSLLDEALKYAGMGLAVFPVRQNKTPYTPHGCKDAKTAEKVIRAWWKRWPEANIGIATGSISGGIVVVDIDIDEDKGIYGDDSLREWEKEHGELPETWRAITGRGGFHYYYRSDQEIKNATSIYPGVDVRGEGGYVVAPPSIHQNGNSYQWEISPDEMDIHFLDDRVKSFITGETKQDEEKKQEKKEKFRLPAKIASGQRNNTLFKYACSLQSIGYEDEEIFSALTEANQRCDVPLPDDEIKTIYGSAISKPKGERWTGEIDEDGQKRYPIIKKSDDDKVLQIIENFTEAICYDQALYKKIRLNTLAYSPYIFGPLPWAPTDERIREWSNTDDSNLMMYIESRYGLKPTEKIMHALTIVADRNQYNPVKDMLEACHMQWDGEKHIENLLPDYLGVEKTRYTTEVLKLFMLGAITRAYSPGCKFDYVPIIYGAQGCGKSTFCRVLAVGDEWYDDNFNTIEGDKASEKLRGLWIAEMAELLATKKAKELESIKSFITSRSDNYRPPYARRTEHRARVCVFIGTTNSDHFLTNRTGNRRFLPLIANKENARTSITIPENYAQACIDVRNAWGEAMELYHQANDAPELIMPRDLDEEVLEMQKRFQEDDPQAGIIEEYLENNTDRRICVLELWEKALKNNSKPQKYESNYLHQLMKQNFPEWKRLKRRQKCGEYGVQICYSMIDDMQEIQSEDLPFG